MTESLSALRGDLADHGWILTGRGNEPWSYRYIRPCIDTQGVDTLGLKRCRPGSIAPTTRTRGRTETGHDLTRRRTAAAAPGGPALIGRAA